MAYDYNRTKQLYEGLNDEQKQQFDMQNKDNENYKSFMNQYNAENNQRQTANESNFNNGKGTNWQNQTEWTPYWEQRQKFTDEVAQPQIDKARQNANELANLWYGNQNNQVSPELDQSKFNTAPWQITVKEWTAKDTWKPDYQLSSEARLNEMKSNLDQYFKDSPWMFKDRETFNKVFEYDTRESDAQRQLLDSYWKRKEDIDKAANYTSWDSIYQWMNNAEITSDQLNYIKEYSPEAYREWQQKQEDEIKLRIVNNIVPPLMSDIANQINDMINKLWIQAQDALDIEWIYNDTLDKTWAWKTMEDANNTVRQIQEVNNKRTAIMQRYANTTWWTVSDALNAARMAKALAPYDTQMQGLQYQYQDYANLFNQQQAAAYQAANVRAMQANENQRIWNQKCQALWFATSAMSYRTPEQTKQLELEYQQAQNDIQLLQQSRLNDLNLYNQYQTSKLQNQLQNELTDLSVTDGQQLRSNLNNVLSQYYSQWWDIIQRPQAEVLEDVLAYAKKNWVSVAEALRKNFIEPLQSKQEYKNKIASNYAAPKSDTSLWYSKITINWKDYLTIWWKIIDPATMGIGGWGESQAKPYNIVAPQIMESWVDAFVSSHTKGDTGWQCWKFVNDYLVSIGATNASNRYFWNEDINTRAKRCNQQEAAKWSIAVFNYNHLSDDWINHGHVAIVTQTYADWSFDVIESNYPSGEKIGTRHIEADDASCLGFINPSLWSSTTQWYNTKDPYSWITRYTSTWKEINAGWWITSLEKSFDKWEKLTDTQRKDIYTSYWIDISELNEQRERYMDYVESVQMVDSILDVKKRAEALKEWAEQDTNKNLKWYMDLSIAEQWYANPWQSFWTTDTTIENIQEWKALYDNLMANASFQKYLDMRDKWAQFWIMTDSEWRKIDSSVDPLKWEMKDDLFLKRINSMIDWYNDVLLQLGYDFEEWSKPETAEEVDIQPNSWVWWSENTILERTNNGKKEYSVDGGKTWY